MHFARRAVQRIDAAFPQALRTSDLRILQELENLAAAAAIHIAVYNFVRVHNTLGCTPAMAAGVIGELWQMEELFDAVTVHANRKCAILASIG